jgi:hypothetical protein
MQLATKGGAKPDTIPSKMTIIRGRKGMREKPMYRDASLKVVAK